MIVPPSEQLMFLSSPEARTSLGQFLKDIAPITNGVFALLGVLLTLLFSQLNRRQDSRREEKKLEFETRKLVAENARKTVDALSPLIRSIREEIISISPPYSECLQRSASLKQEIQIMKVFGMDKTEVYQHLGGNIEELQEAIKKVAEAGVSRFNNAMLIYDRDIFLAEIYMSDDNDFSEASRQLDKIIAEGIEKSRDIYRSADELDHYLTKMRGDSKEGGFKISNFGWMDIPSSLDVLDGRLSELARLIERTNPIFEQLRSRLAERAVPKQK